jgi:hypothetical protein
VRLERRNAQPLLDLELFANRRFSAGTAIVFLVYFVYLGVVCSCRCSSSTTGLGPVQASMGVVAGLGPIIVSAPLASRLADRFGAQRPAIASAGAAIASFLLGDGVLSHRRGRASRSGRR